MSRVGDLDTAPGIPPAGEVLACPEGPVGPREPPAPVPLGERAIAPGEPPSGDVLGWEEEGPVGPRGPDEEPPIPDRLPLLDAVRAGALRDELGPEERVVVVVVRDTVPVEGAVRAGALRLVLGPDERVVVVVVAGRLTPFEDALSSAKDGSPLGPRSMLLPFKRFKASISCQFK